MTKEQLELPLYRGKSIKTKQYVEGYLKPCADTGANIYWIQTKGWIDYQVDIDTLSINFPDISTTSENVWYDMEEISKILKEHENGKMETNQRI